ncbi:5'-nucleotidase, lipoprotein e(P4) family [Mucilaginibacter sp.]|uniref:5'-nucleotidase, lipoprotein e(P4) family n=1 Tax=Mucilaginibacter sp. TaxID=1882438 RepID=UPI003B003FCF
MKKNFFPFLILLLSACSLQKHQILPDKRSIATANPINTNGKIMANIWMQRSAEYKALCFQAYNLAQFRLDEALKTASAKPKAIVTDIDETVLDNSPHDMAEALAGKDFDLKTWKLWTAKAEADTIAGAAAFLKYAASKNVAIFYITNRDEDERAGTLKNLQKFNLPNADDTHLLLKQNTSSKEIRRDQVLQNYDVVLFLGDNLNDFSAMFERKTYEDRLQNAKTHQAEFGKKFIVLPNPAYGDWEGALYQYNYQLKPVQKDSVLKKWAIKEASN